MSNASKKGKEDKKTHSKHLAREPSFPSPPGSPPKTASTSDCSDKQLPVAAVSVRRHDCESEAVSEDSGQVSASTSLESDSASSCSGSVFCRTSSGSSVASQTQSVQSLIVSYQLSEFTLPARKAKVSEIANGMLEKVDSEIRKYEASIISQLMSQSFGKDLDYSNVSPPNLSPKTAPSTNRKRNCVTDFAQSKTPLVIPKFTSDGNAPTSSSTVANNPLACSSADNRPPQPNLDSISATALWLMSKKRLKDDALHSVSSSRDKGSCSGTLAHLLSRSSPSAAQLSSSSPLLPRYEHTVEFQEQNMLSYSRPSKSDSYLSSPSFGMKQHSRLDSLSTPLSASDAGFEDIFSLDLFNSANDPNFGFQSPIFAEDPIALSDIYGEEQWHPIHCAARMPKDRLQPSIAAPLHTAIDYYPDVMLHAGYHSQKQQDLPLIAAQACGIDAMAIPTTAPPPYQPPCSTILPSSITQSPHMTAGPHLMFTTRDNHLTSSFFTS